MAIVNHNDSLGSSSPYALLISDVVLRELAR